MSILILLIMAFIAYYSYEHRFKGQFEVSFPYRQLIDRHENHKTVMAYIQFVNNQNGKMRLDHV
jgi:hypothetical protein